MSSKKRKESPVPDQDSGPESKIQKCLVGDHLECVVCTEILSCPVILPCGHTYCAICCLKLVRTSNSCPQCRVDFSIFDLRKNIILNKIVGEISPERSPITYSLWDSFVGKSKLCLLPIFEIVDLMNVEIDELSLTNHENCHEECVLLGSIETLRDIICELSDSIKVSFNNFTGDIFEDLKIVLRMFNELTQVSSFFDMKMWHKPNKNVETPFVHMFNDQDIDYTFSLVLKHLDSEERVYLEIAV